MKGFSILTWTAILGVVTISSPIFGEQSNVNKTYKGSYKPRYQKNNNRYYDQQQAFLNTPQQNSNANPNNNETKQNYRFQKETPQTSQDPNQLPNEWKKQANAQKRGNHPSSYFVQEQKDIIEVAKENPNLSTFVSAVEASGLAHQLKEQGPYTVFAPSNEAFRQLPKGALERLLKPENQRQLYAIISYHVVPGKVSAKDAKNAKIRTVNGKDVNLEISRGSISVDEAEVIRQDIPSSNGVIHIIDEVILPNNQ